MIGRRRDRANSSAACCEIVSVLIMLPIDMKNLEGKKELVFGTEHSLRSRHTQRLLRIQACTVQVTS
jgi:hypothetical protein